METISKYITEKLKINKNTINGKARTKIPDLITYQDKVKFNKVYDAITKIAKQKGLSDMDDLSELEDYCRKNLEKELQTKEAIWAYINIVLGYDYMLDDSDMSNWDEGYLNQDWEEEDPISELAFRAASDKDYKR